MSLDLEHTNIAVLSTHGYRAESVALAVAQRTGCKTQAFTGLDAAALAGFETILIETSPGLEPARRCFLLWAVSWTRIRRWVA